MVPELLAEVSRLIREDHDTVAAIELLFVAVFDELRKASTLPAAQHVVAAASSCVVAHIQRALPSALRSTSHHEVNEEEAEGKEAGVLSGTSTSLRMVTAWMQDDTVDASRRSEEQLTTSLSSTTSPDDVDARELISALLSSMAIHQQSLTECGQLEEPDANDDHEEEGHGDMPGRLNESALNRLQRLLVLYPALLAILREALLLLWVQSARRHVHRQNIVPQDASIKALQSILAWFPQVLQVVRDGSALATQQDADVQYIQSALGPNGMLSGSDGSDGDGTTRGGGGASSSFVSPAVIEVLTVGPRGFVVGAYELLLDCVDAVRVAIVAAATNAVTSHMAVEEGAEEGWMKAMQDILLTVCAVRMAVVAGQLHEEHHSHGGDASGRSMDASAAAPVPAWIAKLPPTLSSLMEECEEKLKTRQQQQQHRHPPGSRGVATASSSSLHHQRQQEERGTHRFRYSDGDSTTATAPADATPSTASSLRRQMHSVSHKLLDLLCVVQLPHNTTNKAGTNHTMTFAHLAVERLLTHSFSMSSSTAIVDNSGMTLSEWVHLQHSIQQQQQRGCQQDTIRPLLVLFRVWVAAAAQDPQRGHGEPTEESQDPQGRSSRRSLHYVTPKEVLHELRDAAFTNVGGGAVGGRHTTNGASTSLMTHEEEQQWMVQRMQRCADLEKRIEPLMLISDDDDDDGLNDENDEYNCTDDNGGSSTKEVVVLPTDNGSLQCRAALSGAMLLLLDAISYYDVHEPSLETPSTSAPHPPKVALSVWDGFTTISQLTESIAVLPIRQLLRSRSLAATSLGLRLLCRLLSWAPRYSVDFPGEVRLTQVVGQSDPANDDDGTSTAAMTAEVECDDLMKLPSDDDDDSTDGAVAKEKAARVLAGGRGGITAYRTQRFGHHYYILQDLLTLVVTNPSSDHRIAARLVVLERVLPWYVAPIRCKLLCHMICTSPYGSIATAFLRKLKEEVMDCYNGVMERLMTSMSSSGSGGAATNSAVGRSVAAHVDAASRWFLNLSMLQHVLNALRHWTRRVITDTGRRSTTSQRSNDDGARLPTLTTTASTTLEQRKEFMEATAVALNLLYSMLHIECVMAAHCVHAVSQQHDEKLEGRPMSSDTVTMESAVIPCVLFEVERTNLPSTQQTQTTTAASSSPQPMSFSAVIREEETSSNRPSAGRRSSSRIRSSSEFLDRLVKRVLLPWKDACDRALAPTPPQPSSSSSQEDAPLLLEPLDAFSIGAMVDRLLGRIQRRSNKM